MKNKKRKIVKTEWKNYKIMNGIELYSIKN